MKNWLDQEAVGWIFWLTLFAALIYPGYLCTRALTYNTAGMMTRIGVGVFSAAIVSGLVSTLVNNLLHRRRMKKHNARRKIERKEKRKRK